MWSLRRRLPSLAQQHRPVEASPLAPPDSDNTDLYHMLVTESPVSEARVEMDSYLFLSSQRVQASKQRPSKKNETEKPAPRGLARGRDSHLGSQLLLSVHQAFDVCRVVAAALAGGDGTFKGGGGDLRGDAGGGAEGPAAEAGGQRVTQRSGDAVSKSLTQQQEVARFLHLRRSAQLPQRT